MNISVLCAQDAYLELYPQSKIQADTNWPDQGKSLEEALSNEGNLGLLLGPKSDVMDVDLDCLEAKALADLILPKPMHSLIEVQPTVATICIEPHLLVRLRSSTQMGLNLLWLNCGAMAHKQ